MKVHRTSILTGVDHYRDIAVTSEELRRVSSGEDIKVICPHLSAEDRQFISDGTTPDEWARQNICQDCEI